MTGVKSVNLRLPVRRVIDNLYEDVYRVLSDEGVIQEDGKAKHHPDSGYQWVVRWLRPHVEAIRNEQRKICAQFED